jgi:hypothetical protein
LDRRGRHNWQRYLWGGDGVMATGQDNDGHARGNPTKGSNACPHTVAVLMHSSPHESFFCGDRL